MRTWMEIQLWDSSASSDRWWWEGTHVFTIMVVPEPFQAPDHDRLPIFSRLNDV